MRTVATACWIAAAFACVFSTHADTGGERAPYRAAVERATANANSSREKCVLLNAEAKSLCWAEASSLERSIKAEARARYRNTGSAWSDARVAAVEADYATASVKCSERREPEKDGCTADAKARRTAALIDARADNTIPDFRTEARASHYASTLGQCNTLSGADKQSCTEAAKLKYGN